MKFSHAFRPLALALVLCPCVSAQQQSNEVNAVPRVIRFNGSYHHSDQQTQTGAVGTTFSIYREQNDGTPLWSEIQNVQPDKDGNYTALLGSTRSDGIPVDLFTTAEPRWLEVEIDQVKQPRILLGRVPLRTSTAGLIG